MGPPWAHAFFAASFLALVGTPVARKLALATDFVDHPSGYKGHVRSTPYLGGVALVLAVLVALLFAPDPASRVAVVVLGAALLGTIGLVDDHRTVHPGLRFLAETAAAVAVVSVGIRIHATGIARLDGALTVVWIVGVTNAANLLDNMDGLAAGVTAAAAAAIFALAALGGQTTTATFAAATVGGCLGFLVYNRSPASIFMGDAGSLFLGFVLAVLTIDVNPSLSPPLSFVVPVVLLAIPVLDTTTVTLSRLRRGLPVSQGGRDHLSHRLVAVGLSNSAAVTVLVVAEGIVGALAVASGRRILGLGPALVAVGCVLGALTIVVSRAPVYTEPVVGLPRRLRVAFAGLALGLPLVAVSAVVAVARAESSVVSGARASTEAMRALAAGDAPAAQAAFDRASVSLARADQRLHAPLTSFGLVVPGVASNLRASRTLVATGRQLAATGSGLAAISEARRVRLHDGEVPIAGLGHLADVLDDVSGVLDASAQRLDGADRPYLIPALRRELVDVRRRLGADAGAAARASRLARLTPALLGAQGTRHYLLAVEDNADLRATGGVVRSWGELTADEGKLALTGFGSIADLEATNPPAGQEAVAHPAGAASSWEVANLSPDFPSSARRLAELAAGAGRPHVDGVVAIDLPGLASLLGISGPVGVAGAAEPVSSANFLDLVGGGGTDNPDPDLRARMVRDVAGAAVSSFIRADVGDPLALGSQLGPSVAGGHLQLYFERPDEERVGADLGVDGTLPSTPGDLLAVINNALPPSRGLDRYLDRRIGYHLDVVPGRERAVVNSHLEVALRNDAPIPASPPCLPDDDSCAADRTSVAVYSPLSLKAADLDGQRVELRTTNDLGHQVHSTEVSVGAQRTRTLRADLVGEVDIGSDGWLSVSLPRQPTVRPDAVEVSVSVPSGWRIAETRGLELRGDREALARPGVGSDRVVALRLQRTGLAGVWDRLHDGG